MEEEGPLEELLAAIPDEMGRQKLMDALDGANDRGGLLDRTALAYLLADEMGLYIPEKQDIGTMQQGGSVDVEGTIARIDPVKHFTRKDGGEGSLISLHIDDGTGSCRLTIFDWKLIEAVEAGEFREGQRVRVIGVAPQDRGYGLELKFSKGSQLVPLEDVNGEARAAGSMKEVEGLLVSVPEAIQMVVSGRETDMVRLMLYTGDETVTIAVPKKLWETQGEVRMEEKLSIGGLRSMAGGLHGARGECHIRRVDG